MKEGNYIPNVDFVIRVKNSAGGDAQSHTWTRLNSYKIFNNQQSIIFSLPGAFTPICSERQVPDFDRIATAFYDRGIDQIFCITVNDYWVVKEWANRLATKHIKFIPDGNGTFTQQMGMLVDKSNFGYGLRSWRYAAIIKNSRIEKIFEEPGKINFSETDPYSITKPENILSFLQKENHL